MGSSDKNTGTIYSISGLTASIKHLLEKSFPIIWVEGEISNFRMPGSGHYYFTLKDEKASISAVMFAGQNRNLKFTPEDGMRVTGLGRISVYEPRGSYQIILEHMMPKGAGELLIAFEQLKKRLEEEGLFDPEHKKPIPFMPATVCIISSSSGAVVHDIINVTTRRFPGVHIQIIPVPVQGENAAPEIAAAIVRANQITAAEVLVVARGGGSLEDLMPFNSESVARAIFESRIPVISAVGHETDFTICDFVADLRAPTPSAAAELMVPVKQDLQTACRQLHQRLVHSGGKLITRKRELLESLSRHLVDPRRHIQDVRLRLDDLISRMERTLQSTFKEKQTRLGWLTGRLTIGQPDRLIESHRQVVHQSTDRMAQDMTGLIRERQYQLRTAAEKLLVMDPEAVLERGYSITRRVTDRLIVRTPRQVTNGDALEILVAGGTINCQVKPDKREAT